MNPRAVISDVLLGIVPIALLIALWLALVSFGYAPAALLPPPGLVFMRLVQQLLSSSYQRELKFEWLARLVGRRNVMAPWRTE